MPPSMQSYPRYISGLSYHPADASMTTSWCWQDLVSFVMPQPATTSRGGTIRPAPLAISPCYPGRQPSCWARPRWSNLETRANLPRACLPWWSEASEVPGHVCFRVWR